MKLWKEVVRGDKSHDYETWVKVWNCERVAAEKPGANILLTFPSASSLGKASFMIIRLGRAVKMFLKRSVLVV